jgi:cobalt-zinc-cadmium efflux system membrane fusion protein
VEAQNMESWVVPDDAIVNYEGKEYVFVDKGSNSFEMVEVTTGLKENEKVQIINYQILMNKKIVIDGAYTLLMKMKNVAE